MTTQIMTVPPVTIFAWLYQPEVFQQLNILSMRIPDIVLPQHVVGSESAENEHLLPDPLTSTGEVHRDPHRARLLWLRSVICSTGILCAYSAFGYADLSDVVAIVNTRFFPAAALCWLILGEKFGWRMGISASRCLPSGVWSAFIG